MATAYDELQCVATGFQRAYRTLTCAFITVSVFEVSLSLTAIVLHSLEEPSVLVHILAMVFESIAAFLAAVIIFVPMDAARRGCRLAFVEANTVGRTIPTVTLRRLSRTDTLWIPHPISRCPLLITRLQTAADQSGPMRV